MTSKLFSPIRIGSMDFANRIAIAPMCQYSADDGKATQWHHVHLGSLALSGAGLLMVEATAVEPRGRITPRCLGLYSDETEAALEVAVKTVRAVSDIKLGIQIAHAGRKASSQVPWDGGGPLSPAEGAWETIAPSALPLAPQWHVPAMASEDDMAQLTAAFEASAVRAVRLGFDVIELHAAHGYLLHEFLSPVANRRTDRYGGSLENRMRFPLQVFEATRRACPSGTVLGVRLTGSDWIDGGIDPDEAAIFANALKERGCDYVDVTSGGISPDAKIKIEPNYQVEFARHVRQRSGIVVRAVGLITQPHQAEAILQDEKADVIALARAMLADPRWPWRAAHELGDTLDWPAQYRRASPNSWIDIE
ncbi:NADH:flavin oxidoreductase/NADH oxidase [Aliihoeflea sp. PC F10.4]